MEEREWKRANERERMEEREWKRESEREIMKERESERERMKESKVVKKSVWQESSFPSLNGTPA
jgi:hypothetical protein